MTEDNLSVPNFVLNVNISHFILLGVSFMGVYEFFHCLIHPHHAISIDLFISDASTSFFFCLQR